VSLGPVGLIYQFSSLGVNPGGRSTRGARHLPALTTIWVVSTGT
jgi:hypothetical protein